MRPSLKQLEGKKRLIGAEVGVWQGANAKNILENLDIEKLYLVDCYRLYDFESQVKGTGFTDKKLKETKEKIAHSINEAKLVAKEKLKDFKNIVWIQKMSHEAAKQIEDESLDFAYIDGNHECGFVMLDIISWMPKVKIGGILGGHDFNIKGVKGAVREMFPMSKWPTKPKKQNNA